MSKVITLKDLKAHLKRRHKKGLRYDLLGFVENKDLSWEVEKLFVVGGPGNRVGWDWVNGNSDMQDLIAEIEATK